MTDRSSPGRTGGWSSGAERWAIAALLGGAGAIHLVVAPSYIDSSAVEGYGLLVAGWVLVALAVAVALRPASWMLPGTLAVGVLVVAAWAVSRTTGLPVGEFSGEAADATVVDLLAVALLLAAGALAAATWAWGAVRWFQGTAVTLLAPAAVLLLATVAITSPTMADHVERSHGDHTEDPDGGDTSLAATDDGNGDHEDHGEAAAADAAGSGDDDGLAQLLADHHYDPPVDEPLDNETRLLLTAQLAGTFDLMEQYPTIADAEADGWYRAGPFIPGLGTHYIPRDLDLRWTIKDGVDSSEGEEIRPLLIYDGLDDDAALAGFMFMSQEEPTGFAGPYDGWHQHTNVCVVRTGDAIELPLVADLDNVTEEMCADEGGELTDVTSYMVHVWSVPGYESELGLFSEVNPQITCPDGAYHRVPYDQLESDETTCVAG